MVKFDSHDFNFKNETAVPSPRWVEILSTVWLCIILIAGTLLNGLTVFVFVRNKHLVTYNNVYILAMVFHDLGLSFLATWMPIVAEISGHWFQLMSMETCVFEAFLVYFVGLALMFILVAMAMSRYIAIIKPFLAARLNKCHSVSFVCLCDFLALCFAVPPLFGWGSYGLEAHGTSCGLDWRDTSDSFLSYLIAITVVCLAIPFAAMIFCYTRIYLTVKQAGINCALGTTHMQTARQEKERLLLKLSVGFVFTYLLSWTPYTIMSFYVAYGRPETIDPLLSRSAALVAKSQVLWNPILYIGFTDNFRKYIFDIFRRRKRNVQRGINSGPSHCINGRSSTEQTLTMGRSIQRIFTISRFTEGTSVILNVLRPRSRLPSSSRKKNTVKKRNAVESTSDCLQRVSDSHIISIGEEEGEEAQYSSTNTGQQTEVNSDPLGTFSKSDSSKESVGSSKDSLEFSARMKTKPVASGLVEEQSTENKTSSDTVHRSVIKHSSNLFRTKKPSFCGDVELHIRNESKHCDGADGNPEVTSSSSTSKSYGIVINVINANNELIPID